MVDISFYQLLNNEAEKVAAKLLEKILLAKLRVVVYAETTEKVEFLNSYLWTYSSGRFLPHGTVKEGMAEHQPIWITSHYENPNNATVLIVLDHIEIVDFGSFQRCLDLFNVHDNDAVTLARLRWKSYKKAGHQLTYWQQDAKGKWDKKELENRN